MNKTRPKTLLAKLTPEALSALHDRTLTNRALAAELGISETYLSRILSEQGFVRLPGPVLKQRKANSQLAKTRTEHRTHLARRVIDKEITLAQACDRANCTERTLWRYLAKVRI